MGLESDLQGNEQFRPAKKNKKKIISGLLILGGIPLLFVLYLVIGPILDILSKDISAKEMYVVSEFVNVRATSDINSLKMGSLDYGTKVLVYEIKDDWAEVLVDGQKVFISSKFVVDPSVYYTIEGIFGDEKVSDIVKNSKYRLALYRYYESKGFTSEIPEEIKKKYLKGSDEKEVYQIFSEPKGSSYTSVVFADFDGDLTQDAAFVLKHKNADEKILVIISFDKKDPLNISKVIYEDELDEIWMSIKIAKKGTSYRLSASKLDDEKLKIPVNGLLIGSNRSKTLADPLFLFYYNGQKFVKYKIDLSDKKDN
jgi:hypothetical protein